MKTPYFPIAAMGLMLSLFACDNESEPAVPPTVATFALENVSYLESEGAQEFVIELSKPATEAGSLSVSVVSDAVTHFSFSPEPESGVIVLPVSKGSTQVSFQVQVVDNLINDGIKYLSFRIREASRGFQIGTKNRLESTWLDDESPSRVAFALERSSLSESAGVGSTVTLVLSHAAPGDGHVKISFSNSDAVYGSDFTTFPVASNGELTLPVLAGATEVSFVVDPLNNALFNTDRKVDFKIETVSPVLFKGQQNVHELTLSDDELPGRAKSYSTSAGNGWSSSRLIHYALDGKIERITWVDAFPGQTTGERLYFYNGTGRIEKVVMSPVTHILYLHENGRIVKAEEYDNNELDRYTLYGYDAAGNIGEVAIYDRQSDGSFVFSLDFVYLYFNDGNLYKKMAYHPVANGEPVLLSTDTYENYIDKVNPFPIEIIHGQPIQSKLPSSYRHETGTQILNYSFSYEFLQDGRPSRRTVSGPSSETTTYEYY
jgi:hypothetical protein